MIKVTLKDGSVREFPLPLSAFEITKSISSSLAKEAFIVKIDNNLKDLTTIIDKDCKLEILTAKSTESLEIIRHDAAHLLAHAVKELYPETQITIGPDIENGFYYDFARKTHFTTQDFEVIEAKMLEIGKRDQPITREVWERNKAIEFFKSMGEFYKAEIISDLPGTEEISLYRQGDFVDLCRGPHGPSTGRIKFFKIMKLAGAYWRGNSDNEMLQRMYGTAWSSKEELDTYLHMLEEAAKRDHRKLGMELDLFHIQDEAKGMIFWHSKGFTLFRIIEQYIRNKVTKAGYIEVKTPVVADIKLWEKSGHIEKFKDDMLFTEIGEHHFALKPMNCPCHVQIFNQGIRSYKQLPIRMAEFGNCHRNESSGSLHGLMRVRSFTQDDAHIFCTEDQITDEGIKFCNLLQQVYKDFGFDEIIVKFSTRPEVRSGSDETWDKAENALKEAVEAAGLEYILNPGEGAFYGPKLEFTLKDAIGRLWQCGTLQVDLVLPVRLDASYIDSQGHKQTPVMLHRAILGSMERFIGILIEEHAGKFPVWLAPTQIAVASVTNEVDDYAREVFEELKLYNLRCEVDLSPDKISYKIRNLSMQKIPIIIIIGKNEKESKNISVRRLGSQDTQTTSLEELIKETQLEVAKYMN